MPMPIEAYLLETGPSIYYNEDFLSVLEDHLTFLRNHHSTRTVVVTEGEAYKFEADLYGLLSFIKVPRHLHYITMRVNSYSSPLTIRANISQLLIPDETLLAQIAQTHQTTHRLT